MTKQIATKEVTVNGQTVTVKVYAPVSAKRERSSYSFLHNEDLRQAERIADVRYQTTGEDLHEFAIWRR